MDLEQMLLKELVPASQGQLQHTAEAWTSWHHLLAQENAQDEVPELHNLDGWERQVQLAKLDPYECKDILED